MAFHDVSFFFIFDSISIKLLKTVKIVVTDFHRQVKERCPVCQSRSESVRPHCPVISTGSDCHVLIFSLASFPLVAKATSCSFIPRSSTKQSKLLCSADWAVFNVDWNFEYWDFAYFFWKNSHKCQVLSFFHVFFLACFALWHFAWSFLFNSQVTSVKAVY